MFDDLDFMFHPSEPRAQLYQAIGTDECLAFDLLDRLEKKLPLTEFAQLACKALQVGSVDLFRRLVECSEPGQVTNHFHLPVDDSQFEGIGVSGSLLTLAAMLDRPQQAQILLDFGYDCNGTGLELSDYLHHHGSWRYSSVPAYVRCSGNFGSTLTMSQGDYPTLSISCATPLSAALLCGSQKTAKVLLRQKGIWKSESSALCRAAVMVLEKKYQNIEPTHQASGAEPPSAQQILPPNLMDLQLETLRQIFCPELETLPDRETFLRTFYLQPSSFIDFCQTSTLRYQLESGLCSEDDARQMLEIINNSLQPLSGNMARSRAGKLLLIKQYFPQLCRESWITGIFLQEIIHRIQHGRPHRTLMNTWKQLCGQTRDLTWGKSDFWCLPYRKLKPFLEEAGKGGHLVMDMDAVPNWRITSQQTMAFMLKTVTFRRRDGAGISGLLQQLLLNGNLRTLQTEAAQRLLATEQPKDLMEFLISHGCIRQDIRSTVLALSRTQERTPCESADWRDPRRWNCWCDRSELSDAELPPMLLQLLYDDVSPETCLQTMLLMKMRSCFTPSDISIEHPMYPNLSIASPVAAACCAQRRQAMELLLKHHAKELLNPVYVRWNNQLCFCGSPLTLSAALGCTEQVSLLLDSGCHPDEAGRGDSSRFFLKTNGFAEDSLYVTPLLAAILFGQAETAQLLLSHGAACDFSRPIHRKVLEWGSADSLALAASLPDTNFESIPKEELISLQIATGENGERTYFWNNLCA